MPFNFSWSPLIEVLKTIRTAITDSLSGSTEFDVVEVAIPTSDTDVSYIVPDGTKQMFIKLRAQNRKLRIYKETTGDFFTIPHNGWLSPKHLKLTEQTIIFQATFSSGSEVIEILLFN